MPEPNPIKKISLFRFSDGVYWLRIFRDQYPRQANKTYVVSETVALRIRKYVAGWPAWGLHATPLGGYDA